MEQTTSTYTIKIQNFEGPLDLLFHLIEKNKMDIYDIRINEIADQYMDYLGRMEELDLEVTSEFLVVASTLLLIKSRMLLPEAGKAGGEQEDLKDDLVSRLIEYKRYKEFTKELRERESLYAKYFYKGPEVLKVAPAKIPIKVHSPELIPAIYKNICERNIRKMNLNNQRTIEEIVLKEKVTIRSKIREIFKHLILNAKFRFSELFNFGNSTRLEMATAFMALLELAKVKRVTLEQKKSFGDIVVKRAEKNKLTDVPEENIY